MKCLLASFLASLLCVAATQAAATPPVAWKRQIGSAGTEVSLSVAVDSAGNAFITGYTDGDLDGPNIGPYDAFLIKYDMSGNQLWSRQIGTTSGDLGLGIGVDGMGNAYVTGITGGPLGAPNVGSSDAFLTKYDGAGNHLWSRQLGTSTEDESRGVAIDLAGNAYIAGFTLGDLGGPNVGFYDAFLTKYDSSGTKVWSRQIGTNNHDWCYGGVAVDGLGNIYVSGETYGNLGGLNAGGKDAFLTKYDTTGSLAWSRLIGTPEDDSSFGVAVDVSGNVYTSGFTAGSLGGPTAGSVDAFLTKYDSSGTKLWSRQIGTTTEEVSEGVAIDGAGSIYIGGTTNGSLGGPNAGSGGSGDAFVAKYDSTGELIWARQLGTADDDNGYGLAVSSSGNAFITGFTTGEFDGQNMGGADAFLIKFAVPEPSTFILAAATMGLYFRRGQRPRLLDGNS